MCRLSLTNGANEAAHKIWSCACEAEERLQSLRFRGGRRDEIVANESFWGVMRDEIMEHFALGSICHGSILASCV